jgi:hypothetical protein
LGFCGALLFLVVSPVSVLETIMLRDASKRRPQKIPNGPYIQ